MRLPRGYSLALAVSVYLLGLLLGVTAPTTLIESYTRSIRSIAMQAYTLPPPALYILILSNNLAVALLSFMGGLLIVPPLLILFVNGVVLGAIAATFTKWYTLFEFLLLILPHGIFEIPAFLLACAAGIDLALAVFEKGFRNAVQMLGEEASKLIIVLVLLAIAAAVETSLIYLVR